MSDTTKIVYVGVDDTEVPVPDIGEWKPGEVKDVSNEQVEWLLTSDVFRKWEPVEDAPKEEEAPKDDELNKWTVADLGDEE